MDKKPAGICWSFSRNHAVLIIVLLCFAVFFPLSAQNVQVTDQENAAEIESITEQREVVELETQNNIDISQDVITITQLEQLPQLLQLVPGSTHTVNLLLHLETNTFRQLKVIFSQIKAFIHLNMSGCTLAKETVSLGGTFKDCVCLLSIIIPEGILYSGDEVFMGCTNLEQVTLPQSLEIVFSSAFSGCSKLSTIQLPPKVTAIGKNAFLNCAALKEIVIPEKVSGIGTGAFGGCTSLENIVITSKSRKYTYVSGILYEQIGGVKAIHSYIKTGSVPLIPPDVVSIYERAFYNNPFLYSLIIPDNIKQIGDEAFAYCSSLQSIEIAGSVSFVGKEAFKGCTSLQEIVLRKYRKIPADWDKNWIGGLLYGIIKYVP